MVESQHWTAPWPALVQSTIVPHASHWYLLPNWFDILARTPKCVHLAGPTANAARQPGLHRPDGPYQRGRYLMGTGSPQQIMVPSPPLVTTNSAPHLGQAYRLPVSFANVRCTSWISLE